VPGGNAGHSWWKDDQGQVSAYIHAYDSLWMPQSLLAAGARDRLVDAIISASRHKGFSFHFNKGLAGAPPEAIRASRDTATNPDVASAFALAIVADGQGPVVPELGGGVDAAKARGNVDDVRLAAAALRKVAPDAGSYVSESDYFNARWKQDFWGANYRRLAEVKARYDPDGLFFVHHGVGSDSWSPDGFRKL
jgi:hypothetical protein